MSDVIGSCIVVARCTTLHSITFGMVGTFMPSAGGGGGMSNPLMSLSLNMNRLYIV